MLGTPEVPHPIGSSANAAVRARIVSALQALGYRPEVQRDFVCAPGGVCGQVENIVARRPGSGPAVLLVSHYDSVPASPGAADGGVGIAAILEVARALDHGPPNRRPIVLLLTDGEELGLLGASAFVRRLQAPARPGTQPISQVVNLEARGTSGASLMFETGPDNRALIELMGGALERPVSTSLFYTVFQQLPNDTDFTVFRRAGMRGFNFGILRGVGGYHSPLDVIARLDPGSLQHEGQNALSLVRALARGPLPPASGDAVYFDLFGRLLLRWPAWLGGPLAIAALLMIAWRARGALRSASAGLGGAALLVAYTLAGSRLAWWLVGPSTAFPADRLPFFAAIWCLGGAIAAAAASWCLGRAGSRGTWAGVAAFYALAAVALAFTLPGLGFAFVVPALAAALAGPRWPAVIALAAAAVWCPLALGVWDAIGVPWGVLTGGVAALLLVALLPPLVHAGAGAIRTLGIVAACAAAGALYQAIRATEYDAESPRPTVICALQDGATSRWLISAHPSPTPEALRSAAPGADPLPAHFPWSRFQWRASPARAPHGLPAPTLEVLDQRGGWIRARLRSRRGAPWVHVGLPPQTRGRLLTLGGRPVKVRRAGGWRVVTSLTTPPEGVELTLELPGGPSEVWIADQSHALPPSAAPLIAARPGWAAPVHSGDCAVASRTLSLQP